MPRERVRIEDAPAAPVNPVQVADAKKIMEKAVVLDVTFHRPGIRRKADISKIEVDADKEMLSLTKEIVDSPDYDACVSLANATRNKWLAVRCLPSPLKRGTYMVPITMIEEVSNKMDAVRAEYNTLADKFAEAYPERVEDARRRLKEQFNQANYPAQDAVRQAFWMETRFFDFGVPSKEKIGAIMWEKERDRAEKTWRGAAEEIQFALRESFQCLVSHLAERLTPEPGAKTKKTFQVTTVEKLNEFLDLFQKRNITNDVELEGLVIQARNVLKGKRVDTLRKNKTVREEVLGEFQRVNKALDKLMTDAPKRQIRFDD
jgi:hypothetical protein